MRIYRNTTLETSKNKVFGYACVYEKESVNLGGFTEIIHRGAITQETINNSDIFATLDHDKSYIVARSRNGKGSLQLSIDDKGLYFEFELPQTEKGNEIRSYLERDEINQCSFCFSLDVNDKEAQKWSLRNNMQYREIFKIEKLYDIALVFQPAYPDSSVSLRKALQEEKDYISEQINILNTEKRDMTPEEKQEQDNNIKEIDTLKSEVKELKEELLEQEMQELEAKLEEKPAENQEEVEEKSSENEEKQEENPEKQEENEEDKEQISEENSEKQQKEDSETVEETPKDEVSEDDEEKEEDKQINNKNKRNIYMKQENFLLKEIRNAIATGNRTFSFPAVNEYRTVTVNDQGEAPNVVAGVHDNIVDTEIQGILEPLYTEGILFNLGCREYKGLPMGDISIPKMSKTSVGWASEIAAATATGVTFENVVLSPKRITAYIDISKMLLAQDSHNAEDCIRRDIVNALNDKLQSTFFGTANSTADQPIGLFYNQTLEKISDYASIAELEADVDDENISANRKYVVSNHTKAALRVMPKSSLTNALMLESGEIDGTPVVATSSISGEKGIYGDFSSIAIGSWGNVELTVDPYTTAINGCVRLIINAYFDWVVVRPEGLKYFEIDED